MQPPAPPNLSHQPGAGGRRWLVGLLVAGGLLSLVGGWLALNLSGLAPGGRAVAAVRPTVAARLATLTPAATPRAVPAPGATPPGELARRYLAAWSSGAYDAMYDLLSPAAQTRVSRAAFRARYEAIADEAMILRLAAAPTAGAPPQAPSQPFTLTIETARAGAYAEPNALPFVLTGGQWGVDWQPSLIFADLRPGDRVRLVDDTPTRGRILDRNGRILAQQVEMATIGIVPGELADAERTIEQIAAALGLDREAIRRQAAGGRPEWFIPLARRPWRSAPENLRALEETPGVEVRRGLARSYPLGPVAAHVVGYVAEASTDEARRLREQGYRAGDWIGAAGVEASAEATLAGERGGQLAIVAPDGTTRRLLAERRARPGRDVYLTIDLPLQEAAEAALGDRPGAIVGLDPATGAVRSLVSRPTFDPNLFVQQPAAARALFADETGRPLLNRATAAAYPPGDLFTPITLAAAMDGLRLPAEAPVECPAAVRLPGRPEVWRGRQPVAEGRLALREALARGCATAFYWLAQQLDGRDPRALPEAARRFGLGAPTGLGLLPETPGAAPGPAAGAGWSAADALNLAVGQGGLEATPLQLARAYAAIANAGGLPTPRLIERTAGPESAVAAPEENVAGTRIAMSAPAALTIRTALIERAASSVGPPSAAPGGYHLVGESAGLSGSAATGVGGPGHAWSAIIAPAVNAHLALIVLVERGGDGERIAAPVAWRVVERGLRPGLSAKSDPVDRPVLRQSLIPADVPRRVGV